MAGKPRYKVPSDQELEALYAQYRSKTAVADSFDPPVPRTTVDHWFHCAERRLGYKFVEKYRAQAKPEIAEGEVSREEVLEARVRELETSLRKSRKLEVQEERLYRWWPKRSI